MTTPELVLPSHAQSEMSGIARAGTVAEQLALQDSAWRMLEVYETPYGPAATRLSNAWMGEHQWKAQMISPYWLWSRPEIASSVTAATSSGGVAWLAGTVVDPELPRQSAVWKVPAQAGHIADFLSAHFLFCKIVFPPSLVFALHAEEHFAVLAGPEAFLQQALPPAAHGAAVAARLAARIEDDHFDSGVLDRIMDHYAPFWLSD